MGRVRESEFEWEGDEVVHRPTGIRYRLVIDCAITNPQAMQSLELDYAKMGEVAERLWWKRIKPTVKNAITSKKAYGR